VWILGEIIIYSATLEYSARSKSIDILLNSYIAMALYCNLYGTVSEFGCRCNLPYIPPTEVCDRLVLNLVLKASDLAGVQCSFFSTSSGKQAFQLFNGIFHPFSSSPVDIRTITQVLHCHESSLHQTLRLESSTCHRPPFTSCHFILHVLHLRI
jgi:hypothetical protein